MVFLVMSEMYANNVGQGVDTNTSANICLLIGEALVWIGGWRKYKRVVVGEGCGRGVLMVGDGHGRGVLVVGDGWF